MLRQIFYHHIFPCDRMHSCSSEVEKQYDRLISLPQNKTYAGFFTAPSNKLIIYSHGNSSTLTSISSHMRQLRDSLQVNVCAYEFPRSPTPDTVDATLEELYLMMRSYEVTLVGFSIGTGPACWLASKYQLPCILLAPYASFHLLMDHFVFFLRCFFPNDWDNVESVRKIKSKILFVHGEYDEIVPYYNSLILYDQCSSSQKNYKILKTNHYINNEAKIIKDFFSS